MTSPSKTSEESSHTSDESFEIIDKPSESYSVSAETYLTLPEEILALSSVDELENAIERCKTEYLSKPENSEDRKWLVRRLIELKLRLENIKDASGEVASNDVVNKISKVNLGHHFILQNSSTLLLRLYCDRCSAIIWDNVHSWYMCSDCGYKCHVKCLSYVCRICAHVVVSENPKFILEICPEAEEGLADQNYRCNECLTHTLFKGCCTEHLCRTHDDLIRNMYEFGFPKRKVPKVENKVSEPRLCDYTGKYYCSTCHWNSTSVIPARIIQNWDFKERNVSRSSKQILSLMSKLPILNLEKLNPVLFACIEELGQVKELRRQLMHIKKYLTSCRLAGGRRLLWQFGDKVHFLENEDSYSLQDLLDVHSGELMKYLNKIRDDFVRHIQVECEVCKGRGFFCELCKDKKIIFPFEENVMACGKCNSAYHLLCWIKYNEQCPKCYRVQQRLLKTHEDEISNAVDS